MLMEFNVGDGRRFTQPSVPSWTRICHSAPHPRNSPLSWWPRIMRRANSPQAFAWPKLEAPCEKKDFVLAGAIFLREHLWTVGLPPCIWLSCCFFQQFQRSITRVNSWSSCWYYCRESIGSVYRWSRPCGSVGGSGGRLPLRRRLPRAGWRASWWRCDWENYFDYITHVQFKFQLL